MIEISPIVLFGLGILAFAAGLLGGFVCAATVAATRFHRVVGELNRMEKKAAEAERRWGELVETVARRTDQRGEP